MQIVNLAPCGRSAVVDYEVVLSSKALNHDGMHSIVDDGIDGLVSLLTSLLKNRAEQNLPETGCRPCRPVLD